jgi:hypothetical protein
MLARQLPIDYLAHDHAPPGKTCKIQVIHEAT